MIEKDAATEGKTRREITSVPGNSLLALPCGGHVL
jgi:hypothetical protein